MLKQQSKHPEKFHELQTFPNGTVLKSMEIKAINTISDLEPFAAQWDKLVESSELERPFSSHAWVVSYMETQLAPDEKWVCLLALEKDQLVGVFPLIIKEKRFMGLKRYIMRTPYNRHSMAVDILLKTGFEEAVMMAFGKYIRAHFPLCQHIEIKRLSERSLTLKALINGLKRFSTRKEYSGDGSYIKTIGNYRSYENELNRRFARNVQRLNRKIEKQGKINYRFDSCPENTLKNLNKFIQIESAGWKGQNGTAIANSQQLIEFYKVLTTRMSELGWLEWHFLELDGEEIAGHMAFKIGKTLTLYKIGFDEKYAFCGPGNLLLAKLIERAFESDNTDQIDFLSYYSWNNNWNMKQRKYYDLYLYPRRPISLITGAVPSKFVASLKSLPILKAFYHFINRVELPPFWG